MSFSSLSFLFVFLPLTLILYYLSPAPRRRSGVLLIASLLFYAWGAPKALPLLVGTALLVWLCGLGMEKGLRFCYPLAVVFVLGSLLLFKYLGFFAGIFGARLSFTLLLPAGISFTTFQLLAYLFDLRRGDIRAERSFLRFLLFVAFFPQLLQGPILRYGKTAPMLGARVVTWDGAVYESGYVGRRGIWHAALPAGTCQKGADRRSGRRARRFDLRFIPICRHRRAVACGAVLYLTDLF